MDCLADSRPMIVGFIVRRSFSSRASLLKFSDFMGWECKNKQIISASRSFKRCSLMISSTLLAKLGITKRAHVSYLEQDSISSDNSRYKKL